LNTLSTGMAIALALFALLQIADVITTVQALKRGGREANPVIRYLMNLGPLPWIAIKLAVAAMAALILYRTGLVWPLWLLNAVYAVVV